MRGRLLCSVMVVVAAAIIASCGPVAGDAEGECDDMLDAYCNKVAGCGTVAGTYDECMSNQRESINCSDAADVDDSYDACLDDIDAAECGIGTQDLPASCQGVILF